jgi:hypothetical protein
MNVVEMVRTAEGAALFRPTGILDMSLDTDGYDFFWSYSSATLSTHAKRITDRSTMEETIYGNAEGRRREIRRGRVREGKKHRDLPDRCLLLTRYPLRFSRFVATVGEFQTDLFVNQRYITIAQYSTNPLLAICQKT